ncbi:MAG: hypothetical protein NC087_04480 [Anaeroplasma bactoclasticum]|nr:hypothetical protein [Anaeroplasma bactoclasticum]
MELNEQYKTTANNHRDILEKVVTYACDSLKISREEFLGENVKQHLKQLLKTIKINNHKAVDLRLERKKVREDLSDIERAFCGSQGGNLMPQGKNTGGKQNNVEARQMEKLKLKELLGQLVLETMLVEKSLESHNNLIIDFLNLIPRKNYIQVLKMTYINCMSNTDIACELCYTTEYVDQARVRGIIDLVQILKCVI